MIDRIDNQQIDGLAITSRDRDLSRYATITVPALLLGGSETPPPLRAALDALENVLPDCRRIEIAGEGHVAHLSSPEQVAAAVAELAGAVLD
jgi:pimeloyl-ACP methyl ester carboxylesterase